MSTITNAWQTTTPCSSTPLMSGLTMELKPIVTANIVSALMQPPDGELFLLIVNLQVFTPADAAPAFSLTGQAITWTSTVYSLNPGDNVVAVYSFSAAGTPA